MFDDVDCMAITSRRKRYSTHHNDLRGGSKPTDQTVDSCPPATALLMTPSEWLVSD